MECLSYLVLNLQKENDTSWYWFFVRNATEITAILSKIVLITVPNTTVQGFMKQLFSEYDEVISSEVESCPEFGFILRKKASKDKSIPNLSQNIKKTVIYNEKVSAK